MQRSRPKNFIQAAKSIAFSTASLLGSNKSVKCVVDKDGNFELTSSVLKLLQIINVEHPAIAVIHDACHGLHEYAGSGCATLVFMLGSCLQSFESLIDQGIPLPVIHQLFDDALACCLEEIQKIQISLENVADIRQTKQSNAKSTSLDSVTTDAKFDALNIEKVITENENISVSSSSPRLPKDTVRIRDNAQCFSAKKIIPNRFSRHLNNFKTTVENESTSYSDDALVHKLCSGLARGNFVVTKLLESVLRLAMHGTQYNKLRNVKLSSDCVFTQIVEDKPSTDSFAFEGLCITTGTEDIDQLTRCLEGKFVKVCLMDFDLTLHSSKHLKKPNICTRGSDENDMEVSESQRSFNCNELLSFGVCCVVFKGEKPGFVEECHAFGIIAIQMASYRHLQALSNVTGTTIVSCLDDLDEADIGCPVKLSVIKNSRTNLPNRSDRRNSKVLIKIDYGQCGLKFITVAICSTTYDMSCLLEESFWSAFNKLRNVLNCGYVVYGCGETELRCAERLRQISADNKHRDNHPLSPYAPRWVSAERGLYRRMVFEEVAKGLERYFRQLQMNTQNHSSSVDLIFDDPFSKTEAWRRAMKLVKSITRVDMVITTGVDQGKGACL